MSSDHNSVLLAKDCQASNEMITKPATTKTTLTTTNISSNLIVEMINDVSSTLNNIERNEKGCKILKNRSSCNDVECGGDYPIEVSRYTSNIRNNTTNNIVVIAADVSKIKNTTKKLTATSMKKTQTTTGDSSQIEAKGETVKPTTSHQLATMSRKKILPTTKTTNTITTLPPTHAKRTGAKPRTTTTTTTISTKTPTTTTTTKTTTTTTMTSTAIPSMKKSLTLRKNKCPTSEPHEISSRRALKAHTSRTVSPIYGSIHRATTTTTSTYKCSKPKSIQCELLESIGKELPISARNLLPTKEEVIKKRKILPLSLAEQKAKLRSDFFKDIKVNRSPWSSQEEEEDNKTELESATSEVQHQVQDHQQLESENHISNHLLKRCSKQNSETTPTPKISGEDIITVLVPSIGSGVGKLSLIDQRKLELSRKFEEQTAVKIHRSKENPLCEFRRVAHLIKKFDRLQSKMIVNPNNTLSVSDQTLLTLKPDAQDQRHNSPLSDEGFNLGQSPYSTDEEHDNDDNVSIRTASTTIETSRSSKRKDKVARSASSDSALGLEVDDPMDSSTTASTVAGPPMTPPVEQQQKRRMTLTVTDLPLRPALLPLAEPTTLPDSPTPDLQHTLQNVLAQTTVPSKVLLEERVVEIPEEIPLRSSGQMHVSPHITSRRESELSCLSDYPFSESGSVPGVRYVRTPSVVVSDYSDDVMCGITLEEIEYFRAQRLRRRSSLDTAGTERDGETHSDVSASSSCSNLYYCGSTISALDGAECLVNGQRVQLERKASDCSSCSASGNDDETTSTSSSAFTLTEDNTSKDISDLLAAQHLCSKRAKKVGNVQDITTFLNISDK